MRRLLGFTLIESIIAMVLIGFAMLTLTSFLYPKVQRSAIPHYQIRAANLEQSLMNRILARSFDENSDNSGSDYRCGENDLTGSATTCTTAANLGSDSGETVADYDDVDDYIGCWWSDNASDCGTTPVSGQLSTLLDLSNSQLYAHFTVKIAVSYIDSSGSTTTAITDLKRISLSIDTGQYGQYSVIAFRGNY
ncbi:MSHA biogenesis protein MshD [Vibrio sp. CAIM 722]|uniref:MSHA biogenesis protein MshD n=1 Tax=Vibrio eleionomae TaxID=2653505 RepID=A0A7X4LJD6_9VIBR|nr:MSHA biogenesis protein MshD [Vibrio eleionomae]MZI92727.1 MSHA biogenesis protein MshD [Vibrio eleionomae]